MNNTCYTFLVVILFFSFNSIKTSESEAFKLLENYCTNNSQDNDCKMLNLIYALFKENDDKEEQDAIKSYYYVASRHLLMPSPRAVQRDSLDHIRNIIWAKLKQDSRQYDNAIKAVFNKLENPITETLFPEKSVENPSKVLSDYCSENSEDHNCKEINRLYECLKKNISCPCNSFLHPEAPDRASMLSCIDQSINPIANNQKLSVKDTITIMSKLRKNLQAPINASPF